MTATRRAFPRAVKVYRGARRRWPALEAAHASGKYVRETAELILAADDPDAILAFLQGVRDSRTAQASPAELEALVLEDIATDAEDVGASVPALLGRPEAVEAAIAATERDIAVDRRKLAVLWATLKIRRKA